MWIAATNLQKATRLIALMQMMLHAQHQVLRKRVSQSYRHLEPLTLQLIALRIMQSITSDSVEYPGSLGIAQCSCLFEPVHGVGQHLLAIVFVCTLFIAIPNFLSQIQGGGYVAQLRSSSPPQLRRIKAVVVEYFCLQAA